MELLLPATMAARFTLLRRPVPERVLELDRRWRRRANSWRTALRRGRSEATTCTLRQQQRRRPWQMREEAEDRIREQLRASSLEQQPSSSYDTAWVAMVPAARGAPCAPRFPRYVEWIMQNQNDDGSWGLAGGGGHLRVPSPSSSSLRKDAISSTLACVLALKTWNIGDDHVRKGLRFIGNNWSCAIDDDKCETPIGFNIIVPGMIRSAIALGLELPLAQSDVNNIIHLREMELQRHLLGA